MYTLWGFIHVHCSKERVIETNDTQRSLLHTHARSTYMYYVQHATTDIHVYTPGQNHNYCRVHSDVKHMYIHAWLKLSAERSAHVDVHVYT